MQQMQQSKQEQQELKQQELKQQELTQPKGGWNPSFTDRDKTEYADLHLYIKQFHTDVIADIMTQMIIYKRKYHLKYSEEQEQKIAALFTRQKH
jgi:hypothetical protein